MTLDKTIKDGMTLDRMI